MIGAVELGGTWCRCAVGDGPQRIGSRASFTTGEDPEATVKALGRWFRDRVDDTGADLEAIGVASFGPLDVVNGRIAASPKVGWKGFGLRDALRRETGVPVIVDTDVNGSALGEWTLGAGSGLDGLGGLDGVDGLGGLGGLGVMLYVTVGTGIGVGAMVEGRLVYGAGHPEMGHMSLARHPDDHAPGFCPYHKWCWEGIASGDALARRHGVVAAELVDDEAAWDLEAHYLAVGVANLVCTYRPQRIVMGGGVLGHPGLFDAVRANVPGIVNTEYFPEAARMEELLVPPGLGNDSGLVGALILAQGAASP